MEMKQLDEALNFYIRPGTFPLAIKMLKSPQEIPAKARIPKRDLSTEVTLCQAMAMACRYGWTVAMGKDDHHCPYGAMALGQVPAKSYFLDGSYWQEGMMPGSREAAAMTAQILPRFEYGRYSHVLLAPVARAEFEPDIIAIYGNSAQVARLVQAAVHNKGGVITASSSGGRDCADVIVTPLLDNECHFILPGDASRIWGLIQDTEMIFSLPADKMESVISGLEATHKMGARYPTASFLRFAPQQPPPLRQLMETLRQPD